MRSKNSRSIDIGHTYYSSRSLLGSETSEFSLHLWNLVYIHRRAAAAHITHLSKGIISIIILLYGHTSLTRHTSIDAWEQCNHTRKYELNLYLVHALEQPPMYMYYRGKF